MLQVSTRPIKFVVADGSTYVNFNKMLIFFTFYEFVGISVCRPCVFANAVVKEMLGLRGGWEGVDWIYLNQDRGNK
jgi:hypothetical protein